MHLQGEHTKKEVKFFFPYYKDIPHEGGWKYQTEVIVEKAAVAEVLTSWQLMRQFRSGKFQTQRCGDVDYILSLLAGLECDTTANPDILSQASPTQPASWYSVNSVGRGKYKNTQALQIAFTEQYLFKFWSVQQDGFRIQDGVHLSFTNSWNCYRTCRLATRRTAANSNDPVWKTKHAHS